MASPKIVIDHREKRLISATRELAPTANIEVRDLPLGDMVVENGDGQALAVIERKTPRDLAASIRDGRYSDQAERLAALALPAHHVYFVIEGHIRDYEPEKYGRPVTKDALRSALVRLGYDRGFSIQQTASCLETAEWLVHFANRVATMAPSVETGYRGGQHARKSRATAGGVFQLMLEQIPGVGTRTAEAIVANHANIAVLHASLRDSPDSVADITVGGRRIGRKLVDSVAAYMRAS